MIMRDKVIAIASRNGAFCGKWFARVVGFLKWWRQNWDFTDTMLVVVWVFLFWNWWSGVR